MSKEETPDTMIVNNPYVTCHSCGGYGLQSALEGVTECYECGGDTVVRDRDAKGRFTTHPEVYVHVGGGFYEVQKSDQVRAHSALNNVAVEETDSMPSPDKEENPR